MVAPADRTPGVFRVAVLDDYQQVATRFLRWTRPEQVAVAVFHDHVTDPDQLAARLTGFDGVVVMRERTPLTAELFDLLPSLRLIVTAGFQNALIDLEAARRNGIVVCGTRGWASVVSTVEHTWALILGMARRVAVEDAAVRAGGWQRGLATGLQGRRLGIVGLGTFGALVVPVARALGMEVVAWSRNLTAQRAEEVGIVAVSREELFSTSQVVTVHIKLSERSRGYVGRDELALMAPGSLLVNTSRGPVVDERALVEALRSGRLAGAALDVFDEEPLPVDSELRLLPNVVLSPHHAYANDASYEDYFTQIVEDVEAFVAGNPIREVGTIRPPAEDPPVA
ncbi:MAG: D-2-hydroxyacid dehydrogenase family protein [Acidimicrobiales bacterium]|nr:D-2-hydroxyacid dehydrogenase family protein [Acidimicrobiales bacterium]